MRRLTVVNHLPAILRRRGIAWGELRRRTLLPAPVLRRLRRRGANPRLLVAERVASALDLPVERLWMLR
jgi:hypothetical protein